MVQKKVVPLHPQSREMHFEQKFSAEIAQLVEHNLAKVGVAGPSPVFRSQIEQKERLRKALIINCPGGGIGRRARFRCVCRKACRFESCSGHSFFQYVKICWRGGGIGRRATLRG